MRGCANFFLLSLLTTLDVIAFRPSLSQPRPASSFGSGRSVECSRHWRDARRSCIPGVALLLSNQNDSEDSRVPFFARTLEKMRRIKEIPTSESPSESGIAVIEKETEEKRAESEAALLRALAEKTRLEAEKMDAALTLAKIEKLEERLKTVKERPELLSALLSDTESLMRKINPSAVVANVKESATGNRIEPKNSSSRLSASDITPISGEELQHRIDEFLNSTQKDRSILASSAGFADASNVTAIVLKLYEYEQRNQALSNKLQMTVDVNSTTLSGDKRAEAIEGFEKLPQQVKDMMARTVGMEDGKNATAVIDKLMEGNRLYQDDDKFSVVAKADDFEDIFIDVDFAEMNAYVRSLLPEVTRKHAVSENDVNAFYSEVLGIDTFNPSGKPETVPGGYIIRGENKMKSKDGKFLGDELIKALDEKIAKSSVSGKIQVYYILDPTPASGDEILNDEDELPLLLITNPDISPSTGTWVKPTVTFFGLLSVATFAITAFSFNDEVLNQLSMVIDSGDGDMSLLFELTAPLAFSILTTQMAHEAGHLIFALKDGIEIGLPTLVPGYQFGITGAVTPITTSPKNTKSLFDFAAAGPISGILVSFILLYTGLEMTVFMDAAGREQLPSMPIQVLRSSSLGSGLIEYLMGDGLLNSPDPAETIKLHPYAIAGFGGLITNALNLLPIGNTDGGRICVAFFGRSFSRVVQGTALLVLIVAGLFGGDEANILLSYALFAQFWQKEPEVPCRNEVDELDSVRGIIAIALSLFVMLTLVPLPS